MNDRERDFERRLDAVMRKPATPRPLADDLVNEGDEATEDAILAAMEEAWALPDLGGNLEAYREAYCNRQAEKMKQEAKKRQGET